MKSVLTQSIGLKSNMKGSKTSNTFCQANFSVFPQYMFVGDPRLIFRLMTNIILMLSFLTELGTKFLGSNNTKNEGENETVDIVNNNDFL